MANGFPNFDGLLMQTVFGGFRHPPFLLLWIRCGMAARALVRKS
jgi:hypothetical protein